MAKSRLTRHSGTIFILVVVLLIALFLYIRYHRKPVEIAKGFPAIADKPKPVEIMFRDCPPIGLGGDPDLNLLKNRVDEGDYVPLEFDVLEKLPWPSAIERKKRASWSGADADEIAQYEGTPVSIEGYLAGVKEEGPESPNCRSDEHELRDYHMWLTKGPDDDRSNSIVVETTPRVRIKHSNWTLKFLRSLSRQKERFRISGWVMLDPEHPDQVGKTRGTIWEIHPVMKIEVRQPLGWKSVDDMNPNEKRNSTQGEESENQ